MRSRSNERTAKLATVCGVALAVLGVSREARAYPGGVSSYTSCGGCHTGTSVSTTTNVAFSTTSGSFTALPTSAEPGDVLNFYVRVDNSAKRYHGMVAKTSSGVFTSRAVTTSTSIGTTENCASESNCATHSARKDCGSTGCSSYFPVRWTLPKALGATTLYSYGNAVDGDLGDFADDQASSEVTRTVTLACDSNRHFCSALGYCYNNTDAAHCGSSCTSCPSVTNGTRSCVSSACNFTCNASYHKCGSACRSDTDPAYCGASCTSCPSVTNGARSCVSGACNYTCNSGYHKCSGNTCKSNTDAAACGASCTVCPGPTTGSGTGKATCVSATCAIQCNPGYNLVGSQCVLANPNCCGAGCTNCPAAPSNATRTCVANTTCGYDCNVGFHKCGSACVSDTAVASCGTSCTACVPPANAVATCDGVACDFTCSAGFHRCGDTCKADDDASACGDSCEVCAPTANGAATCASKQCSFTCNAGFTACDGICEPVAQHSYYKDVDGDGQGSNKSADVVVACEQPADTATNNTDCNDGDPAVNNSVAESCNGKDDNCDGQTDEGDLCPAGQTCLGVNGCSGDPSDGGILDAGTADGGTGADSGSSNQDSGVSPTTDTAQGAADTATQPGTDATVTDTAVSDTTVPDTTVSDTSAPDTMVAPVGDTAAAVADTDVAPPTAETGDDGGCSTGRMRSNDSGTKGLAWGAAVAAWIVSRRRRATPRRAP